MAKDLDVINVLLSEAMEHGLESEVIFSALKAMKEDNTLTPALAMQTAMDDWIK